MNLRAGSRGPALAEGSQWGAKGRQGVAPGPLRFSRAVVREAAEDTGERGLLGEGGNSGQGQVERGRGLSPGSGGELRLWVPQFPLYKLEVTVFSLWGLLRAKWLNMTELHQTG